MKRARDDRGVAFPSPLVLLSVTAVAMAGVAFVVTQESVPAEREVRVVAQQPADRPGRPGGRPDSKRQAEAEPKPEKRKPVVERSKVYVEIYNNSGITGLAGATADRAAGVGWQVVGSDNWVGTIPVSTVYFPERLKPAAVLLGRDLGIERLMPAVPPMRLDGLTVILTAEYA